MRVRVRVRVRVGVEQVMVRPWVMVIVRFFNDMRLKISLIQLVY